jgi:hypothetical protein
MKYQCPFVAALEDEELCILFSDTGTDIIIPPQMGMQIQ